MSSVFSNLCILQPVGSRQAPLFFIHAGVIVMKRLMWLAVMLLSFGFVGCGDEEEKGTEGDAEDMMDPDATTMDPGSTLPEGGPEGDDTAPTAP